MKDGIALYTMLCILLWRKELCVNKSIFFHDNRLCTNTNITQVFNVWQGITLFDLRMSLPLDFLYEVSRMLLLMIIPQFEVEYTSTNTSNDFTLVWSWLQLHGGIIRDLCFLHESWPWGKGTKTILSVASDGTGKVALHYADFHYNKLIKCIKTKPLPSMLK